MLSNELKRELIVHKIYSAWQFIEYTENNIEIVRYCSATLKNLIKKLEIKTERWEKDLTFDFDDEVNKNGKRTKRLSVTSGNVPKYEVRVIGDKVNPWFLFNKLLRDFFQYAMNSFDSMSQIINAGLLANHGKKVDSVDIQKMISCFAQQTYKTAFPKMHMWLEKLSQSDEFKYIEAINNRTKHTADIANKLSIGIFGSSNTAQIGSFFRKKEQHDKKELVDQLNVVMDFLIISWNEFLNEFKAEYINDTFIQNRRHEISGVRQQKINNQPEQNLSYAYINVENDFTSMPEEIYVLFVKDDGEEIISHECPFNMLFVVGNSNLDILGRYIAEEEIGDDCLLTYRKYIKDNNVVGGVCRVYIHHGDKVFYHANPFFNVETVSDDELFLKRISLPF